MITFTEQDDFDVSFFPEGGNLPEGVFSKVAFKALTKTGFPETISGTIIDDTGAEITAIDTRHAGMDVFAYLPESGKKYYLKCENANGLEKQFELPQPDPRAYSLMASAQNEKIVIGVQKSVHAPDIPSYLLAHCRGDVLYFEEWDHQQEFVSFMEEEFPAGVIQFILFDGQMNPLSERLMFSKNDASAQIDFHTDKEVYEKRDKVVTTLSFPDSLPFGEGWGGASISIAITDDKDIAVDESTTILSSLLLSSELKGYIENPAYYLQDSVAMDLLMMTHGWRRYNIPEVIKGNPEHPQIPFQIAQEISGQVKPQSLRRPIPGSEIFIMMNGEGGGVGITSTDAKGSFIVQDLLFPDSTTFYIWALNSNGRDNVQLNVDHELFPKLVYAPQSLSLGGVCNSAVLSSIPDVDAFMEKAEQRAKFEEDIWSIQLEEVRISAPRITKVESRNQFWANASSDNTITRETIEQSKLPYFHNYLLAFVGGIRVQEDPYGGIDIFIRGNESPAHVFIDGIERPYTKYYPSVSEIESIDVFKGPSAVVFGFGSANGVISITTKRGSNSGVQIDKSNHVVYTPLGYQKPVAFYSPKYETLEAKQSKIPDYRTTIFWKPDVVISEDGEVSFQFYTSDFSTTYSVVIEGITADGRMVRQVEKINVR